MLTERSTLTELSTLIGCHPQVVPGAAGTPLAVSTAGNPHGLPLVLLHGLFQSARSWSSLLGQRQLQRAYHLIAWGLRGHGASEKPGDTRYQDSQVWADDIHAGQHRMDLDHPMLVGWSCGGAIIGDYLRHYGDRALGGLVQEAAPLKRLWRVTVYPAVGHMPFVETNQFLVDFLRWLKEVY